MAFDNKIIIMVVIVGFIVMFNGSPFLPFASGGGTLFSVGQTTFESNDPTGFLNGPVWVFAMSQGGMGQYAYGTVPASAIVDGASSADKGFKLEMQSMSTSCSYPIYVDTAGDKIYNYSNHTFLTHMCALSAPPFGTTETFNKCIRDYCVNASGGSEFVAVTSAPLQITHVCIYRAPVTSYAGNLRTTGIYDFSTNFKLTVDDETPVTANITNATTGSEAQLGNVALIKWLGNFVSGEDCPSPTTFNVRSLYVDGRWKLISTTRWNEWATARDDLENSLNITEQQTLDKIYVANTRATAAQRSAAFTPFVGQNITSYTAGKYVKTLDKSLQTPAFTFYVKASELGFNQPVGTARIDEVKSTNFLTGTQGTISTKFTNTSTVNANFEIWATCSGEISMEGVPVVRSVAAGTQTQVWLPMIGTCSTTVTSSCIINVKPMGGGTAKTAPVDISCGPQMTCIPKQRECIEDMIKICNDEGTGYNIVEDCTKTSLKCSRRANGEYFCAGDPDNERLSCIMKEKPFYVKEWKYIPASILFPSDCKEVYDWALILMGIGGAVGIIIVLMLLKPKGGGYRPKRYKKRKR